MVKKYEIKDLCDRFYSGLVCDVLDYFGYPNQSLGSGFSPLIPEKNLMGRAYTVTARPVYEMPKDALVNQCRSIEEIGEGEVYVLAALGDPNCGLWGEIMATGARVKGGVGAIIDARSRDTKRLIEMGFPTFSRGRLPTTSKGRAEIIEWRTPVVIDGVKINPGDLIFADVDGIAVIPQEIEEQVIERALLILSSENVVRDRILAGASIVDTYLEIGAI